MRVLGCAKTRNARIIRWDADSTRRHLQAAFPDYPQAERNLRSSIGDRREKRFEKAGTARIHFCKFISPAHRTVARA
jgi:hypothetical protein